MTPQEVEQYRIKMLILEAQIRASNREFYIDDEKFTLSEVSRKFEVYRYTDKYGNSAINILQ